MFYRVFINGIERDAIRAASYAEADAALWNAAWAIATPRYLTGVKK